MTMFFTNCYQSALTSPITCQHVVMTERSRGEEWTFSRKELHYQDAVQKCQLILLLYLNFNWCTVAFWQVFYTRIKKMEMEWQFAVSQTTTSCSSMQDGDPAQPFTPHCRLPAAFQCAWVHWTCRKLAAKQGSKSRGLLISFIHQKVDIITK